TAAKKTGQQFFSVSFGPNSDQVQTELAQFGVNKHYAFNSQETQFYNPEIYTKALADLIEEIDATTVLASGSALTKDLLPSVAAVVDAGYVSDCVDLNWEGSKFSARKPLYSGKCFCK